MLKINQTSEEKLIRDCMKGKPSAQRDLYNRHAGLMYGICLRYLKEPYLAEDVMITGFTKIFEKIDQFRFSGSFEGWMKRIMVNESLSYIRKNKYMYLEVDIEKAEREPDYSMLTDQLEAKDLLKLIQDLPVGYRTVFNLYAIEGYSHKEIAEQLGINENTSKSQLSRARALLQKNLIIIENEAEYKRSGK